MWAAFPKFPGNFPMNVGQALTKTLNELKAHSANSSDVFVIGHSLGAFVGQDYLSENSTGYKGLVLLGKFMRFKDQDPQVNYPLPVLTISGELDGLPKISRLAMSFNQMLRHPKGQGHIRFPVAIIPGAYHSSFITGDIPHMINASDIKPEISGPEAWQICAKLIDAFVDAQLHLGSLKTNRGAKYLADFVYGSTYPLMKPLLDAFALEENPYLYNQSVVNTTRWVSYHIFDTIGVSTDVLPTILDTQDIFDLNEFYHASPSAKFRRGMLDYQVYTNKQMGDAENDDIRHPLNCSLNLS